MSSLHERSDLAIGKVVRNGLSFDVEIGRPDSNAIFFLDPPSGLGRQTPATAILPILVSADAIESLTGAGPEEEEDSIVLIDRNSETPCLAIAPRSGDAPGFGNVELVLRWGDFRRWALTKGSLKYEGYSHDWKRHAE